MSKIKYLSIALLLLFLAQACEDPVPTDYIPRNIVQGILIVDDPITNIIVMKSQSIQDSFDFNNSLIRDAEVIIRGDNSEFILVSEQSGSKGYYLEDTTYKVKPNTTYKLEIILNDGTVITGKTTTPERFDWRLKTPHPIQFPLDTIKLPATDSIAWTVSPGTEFYLIDVRCLDTLNYGQYLDPKTEELNRRIYKPWRDDDNYFEHSEWALIPNTKTSVVWNIFKWYGRHHVNVYAPDYNFLEWWLQHFASREQNDLLNSIENGIGVFGSAAIIRDTTFLLKNQP